MTNSNDHADPIDGYDLGQYRWAVAKYVKLMIRARAQAEPEFLNDEQYHRWKLEDIADDKYSLNQLLKHAQAAYDHLWRVFIGPHGSGGVSINDPHERLKDAVNRFSTATAPQDLARELDNGQPIDWQRVVPWELLDMIRDGLDMLPDPGDPLNKCPVIIVDEGQRTVEVLGQTHRLTDARFEVIKVLITQYPGTCTKDVLIHKSKRGGAINVLKGLYDSDSVWESVIKLAGVTGGGYGLHKPDSSR